MPKILVAVTEERLTAAASSWIEVALFDGALAIDATVGNGYDALFLAHRVGPKGKVLGFDVQKAALGWRPRDFEVCWLDRSRFTDPRFALAIGRLFAGGSDH